MTKKTYDLEERTAKFAEHVIDLVRKLESNPVNRTLIGQIIRSASSIVANYMEADVAESKKDFEHKIGICRKESKETHRWFGGYPFLRTPFLNFGYARLMVSMIVA